MQGDRPRYAGTEKVHQNDTGGPRYAGEIRRDGDNAVKLRIH